MSLDTGQWSDHKRRVSRKQGRPRERIPSRSPQERLPLSPAYARDLARRLSESALVPPELALQHVLAVAIRPLPPRRPPREKY
jgi:hypothetical protein